MLVDRRNAIPPSIRPFQRSNIYDLDDSDVEMEDNDDDDGRVQNITERWRFDADDVPAFGPDGPEEQNRTLVDDYAEKYYIIFLPTRGN